MKPPRQKRRPTNHPVVLDLPPDAPAVESDARWHQDPAAAAELIQAGTNVHIAGAKDQAQGLTAAELAAATESCIKLGVDKATETLRLKH